MIKVYKGYNNNNNNKIDIIKTIKLNTPSWLTFTLEIVCVGALTYLFLIGSMVALDLLTHAITFIN